MCGPVTRPMTLASIPKWPERLDQGARDLLLPGRVGLGRLAGRAHERARRGHAPDEVGVVGDRGAVAALGREVLEDPRRGQARGCPGRAQAARGARGARGFRPPRARARGGTRGPDRVRPPGAPRRVWPARQPRRCPAKGAKPSSGGMTRRRGPRRTRRARRPRWPARRIVAVRSSVERRRTRPVRGHMRAARRGSSRPRVAPVTSMRAGEEQEHGQDVGADVWRAGARRPRTRPDR